MVIPSRFARFVDRSLRITSSVAAVPYPEPVHLAQPKTTVSPIAERRFSVRATGSGIHHHTAVIAPAAVGLARMLDSGQRAGCSGC